VEPEAVIMPIDSSIYAQFAPKVQSPLDVENGLAQASSNRINNQNALQAQSDAANLRQAVQGFGTDPTANRQAIAATGNFQALQAYDKAMRENVESQSKVRLEGSQSNKADADARAADLKTKIDGSNFAIQQLNGVNSVPNALNWANQQHAKGFFSDGDLVQHVQNIMATGGDPQKLAAWKDETMQSAITATDQAKIAHEDLRAKGNNQATMGAAQLRANATLGAANISAGTSRANNAANIAKDYKINGLGPDGSDAPGTSGLTPAAIENAAGRFNLDGTMATQGRGPIGQRDQRSIQNRAAELALGTDPTQLRINQMDAKSGAAALTQLTRAQTMAGSFEKTANSNLQLALGLSKQLDRTGIPLINAGIQAWRTGTGSPEATQFAAANATFVGEYAKIMSGGMGSGPVTDAASNKAQTLLQTSMTPDQYEKNAQLLQTEMRNRMKGFSDQADALRAHLAGKSEMVAPPAAASGMPTADAIAAELKRRGH
jgi:hypothetical protein